MAFQKATKKQSKARMAIISPSGAGKTMTALRIARGLCPTGKIAVLDTERGSASKYSDTINFDVDEDFRDFSPITYVEKINAAVKAGYEVLIIDSLSHAWIGKGGAIDQVDAAAKRSKSGNSFTAWRDVTPQHNAMIDAIVSAPLHIIVTLRAKTEYSMEKDDRGKTVPKKIGVAAVQRDGLEYEFDIVGEINQEHELVITKTRCQSLVDGVFLKAGESLGDTLRLWLTEGAVPPPPQQQSAGQMSDAHWNEFQQKLNAAFAAKQLDSSAQSFLWAATLEKMGIADKRDISLSAAQALVKAVKDGAADKFKTPAKASDQHAKESDHGPAGNANSGNPSSAIGGEITPDLVSGTWDEFKAVAWDYAASAGVANATVFNDGLTRAANIRAKGGNHNSIGVQDRIAIIVAIRDCVFDFSTGEINQVAGA